jgi:hypothetical protein
VKRTGLKLATKLETTRKMDAVYDVLGAKTMKGLQKKEAWIS